MISKAERTKLIAALNTTLMLHVPDREDRKEIATDIAEALNLPFLDHFVAACLAQ